MPSRSLLGCTVRRWSPPLMTRTVKKSLLWNDCFLSLCTNARLMQIGNIFSGFDEKLSLLIDSFSFIDSLNQESTSKNRDFLALVRSLKLVLHTYDKASQINRPDNLLRLSSSVIHFTFHISCRNFVAKEQSL
jgi:hypothetical protein